MDELKRINAIVNQIRNKIDFIPKIGIVLGSGLKVMAGDIDVKCIIPFSELNGFPISTVSGHKGEYVFGYINDVPVVLMNGRVHYYEGYSMVDVVLPVRVMALLGAESIILTNAVGGLNESYHPGTIMCIKDQILYTPSPLIGPNIDEFGPRFPDVSQIYNEKYIDFLHQVADKKGINVEDGVFIQITGPAYETPAEARMYRAWGADAVAMSLACEALALSHMGKKVIGISCVTDMAIHEKGHFTTHEEVMRIANETCTKIIDLIKELVVVISNN